jgi:hypothetical protein
MNQIGDKLLKFYKSLELNIPEKLGIDVLNPYKTKEVLEINRIFYQKFYSDNHSRTLILGINPGRFGAGITGISFTDPIVLDENLNIQNNFQKKPELSATFIHQMINRYGGPNHFYQKFHLSAICPLGFVRNNININYYDDNALLVATKPFIIQALEQQLDIIKSPARCICIGRGKNLDFLLKLNAEKSYFEKIDVLPHPRWILQYRRKLADRYFLEYVDLLKKV